MTDVAGAQWIPTTHFWADANQPRYVIVHGTGSSLSDTPQAVGAFFQRNNPPTSTHYGVGRDGALCQYVLEKDAAWGNGVISHGADPWWTGNPNQYTVSIEHINNSANSAALTAAEQATSFALIADICQRHGIPMRPADASGGITGHYSIDPVHRAYCPGNYPWKALWAYLGTTGGTPGLAQQLLGGGATLGTLSATVPAIGSVAEIAGKVSAQPGFAPLAQALDDAEQMWPLDAAGGPGSWVSWAGSNLQAFAVRGLIASIGWVLIILVAAYLLRRGVAGVQQAAGQVQALVAMT